MFPVRNPLVWLRRIRHRRGYGIHSPFAYNLVTQVIYSPGDYYDYQWLDLLLPQPVRMFSLRPLACHRLLFRLANYWQPTEIHAPEDSYTQQMYLHAGCRQAQVRVGESLAPTATEAPQAGCFLLRSPRGEMTVVYDLQCHRTEWKTVRKRPANTVTFDLHDMGIAVATPKLNRQHYVINW